MRRAAALLRQHVLPRPGLSFLLLGVAFFVFAACTLNLATLLAGNLALLGRAGWQAAMAGALRQLGELVATGYLGIASYVVLKACEHRCVQWLNDGQ